MSPDTLREIHRKLESTIIEHSTYRHVLGELESIVTYALPGSIVLLVGAPGTGVTAIARACHRRLQIACRPENPFCAVELVARVPTRGRFHWKDFWESGLEVLEEPILGQRRRATESAKLYTEFLGSAAFRAEDNLRRDFEHILHRRGCRTLFISGADAMLRRAPDDDLTLPLEIFQQMAARKFERPKVVVMGGGIPLLRTMHRKASLDLHTTVLHVPPLSAHNEAAAADFISAVKSFEEILIPLVESGTLVGNASTLHAASAGCIGWLKQAISDALARMEERKKERLNWKDIQRELPRAKKREVLQHEISTIAGYFEESAASSPSPDTPDRGRSRNGRRVGERNPSRDRVGSDNE
jgi:hypothetical protein